MWLRRSWDGQSGPLGRLMIGLLLPMEVLYRGAVALRNRCYDLGFLSQSEGGIPIISVGNLGGRRNGKHPLRRGSSPASPRWDTGPH